MNNSTTYTELNSTGIAELINSLGPKDQPIFISGAPGIGKSELIKSLDETVYDYRASYHDPGDVHGLPFRDGEYMGFLKPKDIPETGKGIFFADELPNAPRATQSALLQLMLDGHVGECHLSPNIKRVAAGNRLEDRAGVNPMISSLAARFTHIHMVADLNSWSEWAINHDINIKIIAFLRFRRELLHAFDPDQTVSPNPRAWSFVNNLLNKSLSEKVLHAAINGTVGSGAGTELIAFMRIWDDLPNVDHILMNPLQSDIPSDPSVLYALTGSIARAAKPDNLDNVIKYLDRLSEEFNIFAMQAIQSFAKSQNNLSAMQNNRAFVQWCISHQDVIL